MTDASRPLSRPLSPHLQVYRFSYTMATSIFHRATGIVLSLGFFGLILWLLALASGSEAYAAVEYPIESWLGRVVVFGLLVAFWYHTFAGLRHLAFDAGVGLDKAAARKSALWLAIATVVASAITAYFLAAGVNS